MPARVGRPGPCLPHSPPALVVVQSISGDDPWPTPGMGRLCTHGVPQPHNAKRQRGPGRDTPAWDSSPVGVTARRDSPRDHPPPWAWFRGGLRIPFQVRVPVRIMVSN